MKADKKPAEASSRHQRLLKHSKAKTESTKPLFEVPKKRPQPAFLTVLEKLKTARADKRADKVSGRYTRLQNYSNKKAVT